MSNRPARHNAEFNVDCIVIGGGIVGISAALRAADAGKMVAILDGSALGSGMSSQSAGHVMTGFLLSPSEMIECVGPRLTLKLQKWVHLAKQEFAQRWRSAGLGHSITPGYLLVGRRAEHEHALADIASYWRTELGLAEIEVLARPDLEGLCRSSFMSCLLHDPTGFTIDPAALASGLRQMACHERISIIEDTAVFTVEDRPNDFEVHTRRGIFRAPELFVATGNSSVRFSSGVLVKLVRHKVLVAITEPLAPDLLEYVSPSGIAGGSDCSQSPDYWTVQKDGRLMFGFSIDAIPAERSLEALARDRLTALFPLFAEVQLAVRDVATVDGTESGLPHLLAPMPGLKIACGFNGLGLAAGYGAGQLDGVPWNFAAA
jgi:glycine/D-amino acid oxidase-like deaminating enzyme